jgi:hypothetical protein
MKHFVHMSTAYWTGCATLRGAVLASTQVIARLHQGVFAIHQTDDTENILCCVHEAEIAHTQSALSCREKIVHEAGSGGTADFSGALQTGQSWWFRWG